MSDDYTDPAQLNVVMEYQFGSATADDWYDKPYFEDMTNLGGGRYEYTFGPYLTEGDFRIRFTVRATDADGATAQLLERTILVRNCPPPPPPNQAPRIEWIDSGNGLTLNSTVDGFKCWPNLPDTVTVTANVEDDTTPYDKLEVYLVWMYGEVNGESITWLNETIGAGPMTNDGNGQFSFLVGPYSATRDYAVAYYVAAKDADGATTTNEAQLAGMWIRGCVIIY
jgi:hypothetical protein